ncbi:MAG: DUF4845 domain-containing protein [Pseudomonadales bacterium]|nr:DUF4845 domain-containing protein [Pseudomonadales bacterium]
MKTHSRQQGMSIPGMLAVAAMVGFFIMCIVRMAPHYFEYLSVREIITKIAQEYDPDREGIADIRRRIETVFNTNQIYDLKPKDVEVFRKDGRTFIDARYEARVPIMGNVDAIMNFDDLEIETGRQPY